MKGQFVKKLAVQVLERLSELFEKVLVKELGENELIIEGEYEALEKLEKLLKTLEIEVYMEKQYTEYGTKSYYLHVYLT